MEEKINKRVDEIKAELMVFADSKENKFQEILINRDNARTMIKQYEESANSYKVKLKDLEAKMTELKSKVADILAKGKEPKEITQKTRDVESEIGDITEWINELNSNVIPTAVKEQKKAETALTTIFTEEILKKRAEKTERLDKLLFDVQVEILSWHKAVRAAQEILGIKGPRGSRILLKLNRVVRDQMRSS